jgi:Uma2 family endonuclease
MATTIPILTRSDAVSPPQAPPLPLESGDRLTRAEFERRYEAMPGVKAELIKGVVYMASPVRYRKHGRPHGKLLAWIAFYVTGTPGVDFGAESSLKLDDESEVQPDALLCVLPSHGGQARTDDADYLIAAPEWAGEVAASSASYDLHDKLDVYRGHGVREYLVWRVLDRAIDWFILRGDRYERLPLSEDGLYRSEAFPGLWLDPQALIAEDLPKLQADIQRGLATPEHQQFVERLARAAAQP